MASLSSTTIIGNLGSDPELRWTPSGKAVVNISVAVNRNFKDAQGEWQKDTTWFRVVDWNDRAERLAEQLKKGHLMYAEGQLRVDEWTDRDGGRRYTLEILANKAFSLEKREATDTFSTGGKDEDINLPDMIDEIPM